MKTLIIEIHAGIVHVVKKPQGIKLIIKDFDVQEETKYNDNGKYYTKEVYED